MTLFEQEAFLWTETFSLFSALVSPVEDHPATPPPVKSVDDFVPEDALDASFLDDTKDVKELRESKPATNEESDRYCSFLKSSAESLGQTV